MAGYEVTIEQVSVAGRTYAVRSLLDLQQYADPDGAAAAAGFSSANWSLFGRVWPSAHVLAAEMTAFDVRGRRVLEVGAGLALASLVLASRGEDITASDSHPLAETFLVENARLNGLPRLPFFTGAWAARTEGLGTFDLIIGSDVLYDHGQAEALSGFIDRHSKPDVEVVIVDPNRGHRVHFCRAMERLGYTCEVTPAPKQLATGEPYKGQLLHFRRQLGQTQVSRSSAENGSTSGG